MSHPYQKSYKANIRRNQNPKVLKAIRIIPPSQWVVRNQETHLRKRSASRGRKSCARWENDTTFWILSLSSATYLSLPIVKTLRRMPSPQNLLMGFWNISTSQTLSTPMAPTSIPSAYAEIHLPVPPFFTLFDCSDPARYLNMKPAMAYHNPGCQGYCHPSKCSRMPRCRNCGQPTIKHGGPSGNECTKPSRCVNCHFPHPADHKDCPVAPGNRKAADIPNEEVKKIRAEGNALYRAQNHKPKKSAS